MKIGSSWANVNYASDHWNLPHVHISEELTSDLSGALYVQTAIDSCCGVQELHEHFDFLLATATKQQRLLLRTGTSNVTQSRHANLPWPTLAQVLAQHQHIGTITCLLRRH